jgi:hypothetical protein
LTIDWVMVSCVEINPRVRVESLARSSLNLPDLIESNSNSNSMIIPTYAQALAYAKTLGLHPTSAPAIRLPKSKSVDGPHILLQLGGEYEGCTLTVWFEDDGSIYGEY